MSVAPIFSGSRALHFTVMRTFLRRPTSICPRSTNVNASPYIRCILCRPQRERDAARDSAGVMGCKIHTLWQGQIPSHQLTYRRNISGSRSGGRSFGALLGRLSDSGQKPLSQAEERVSSTNPAAEPVDVRGIDVTRPPPGDSRPAAVLLDASRVSASRRWRVCLVGPPTLGAPPYLLHVRATAVTEARSLLSFVHHFHITNRALWCR